MESMPPLETVNQAVFTLYKNPNSVEKEKASLWLGELQKSVYAWKIADHILHHQTDVESCYFAAQTMRTKIQLAFHELPTDAHTSLRDSLMEHISKVNEATSSVIITQLCLALADLALQMPSWEKPVLDLINKFSATSLLPLLEIMTVLPEEVNSSRALRLGANRRKEVLEELSQCVPTVSEFLNRCLSAAPDNPVIQVRVLRCFTSWVSVQAITLPEIAENSVVAEAFQILLNKQVTSILHEAAADCVCALLQCLEDNNNQQALEIQLFNGVMALEEGYHMSVAHEDEEKAINYCRIFTELAESFLEKIISGSIEKPHFALKILDLVLTCVGHHDYEVSAITFNLWYRLSEELYQKNNETLITLFKPYVARFIEALCRHCQMDPDLEGRLEDGADFADFRRKVSELIKDVVFIVGSSNCFRQMFINLQAPGVTWDSSEAALFIMQAVAKNILPEENDVVPKVVEAILNLPQNTHIAVRYTSILLLGELCEWIEKHPESLEPVLNCLLFCLQQPQLASAAATSLQSICSSCRNHMGVHFNGLVQIIQSLETFSISNEAAIGLLKGVSVILGRLPHDQIHQAMKEICWVQVKPLCELVQSDIKIERGTKSDPTLWLDRLAVIFRNTNPEEGNGAIHPCLGVFTEVWPIISTTLTKYQTNDRIMERCCRCLRYAVRCVGKSASHILEPLVKQIITIYSQHQHSCFLYLGSILVDEYGGQPGCVDGLLGMLQAFINPTFMLLQETGGLKNHPDTVDDFFRLCNRFIQRAPVAFLTLQSMPSILSCALLAATLDHKDANVSVMKFFYDIIHCGSSSPNKEDFPIRQKLVKEILSEQGGMLVNNLLQASIFSLHLYMLCDVADVILELKSTDKQATSIWLEEACTNLPTTNSVGTQTVTHSQLIDFHQNVMLSESSKEITHCLRDFARLFH